MHRRELELVTTAIRTRREHYIGTGTMCDNNRIGCFAVEAVAKDINHALKQENPSFRSDLFFRACGMKY